ncbi:Ig-like domain-containing protein, partial [Tamlana sp. I1]|uniref:Ig-like domain-containing protein n=1 Tax=Tamlana sp. I1 TaxID=2762061 RepID=UPI0018904CA7
NAAPYPTSSNAKWKITPTNDGAFYIDNQATTANRLSAIASTDAKAEMVSSNVTGNRAKWYIKYDKTQNGVEYYFIECKANFDKSQFYKKSNTEAGMRPFEANDGGRWFFQESGSSVSGVNLNTNYHLMKTVESFVLEANVEPANASEQGVTWSSDDESVATVSVTGEITPLKQGIANITATTIDGSFISSCRLTVLDIDINQMQFINSKASGGLRLSASNGATNPILNESPYPTSNNAKWKITPTNDGAFYIENQAITANRLSAIASTDAKAEMVSSNVTGNRAKWYIKYEKTQNGVDYYFIECKANFDKSQFYKKSNTEAGMRSFAANDGGRWYFEAGTQNMNSLESGANLKTNYALKLTDGSFVQDANIDVANGKETGVGEDETDLNPNQIILKNRNITVTIPYSYSSAHVYIYTLNGKILFSEKMSSNKMNISLNNPKPDVYIILLSIDDKQQVKKFMLK